MQRGRFALVVLGVVALIPVACASTSAWHPTTIGTGRSNDPWLAGERCPEASTRPLPAEVLAKGVGDPIVDGETVRVHYVARLPNGEVLHDSHDDDMPAEIVVGSTKVACGFERAIAGMRPGEERRVRVPAESLQGWSGGGTEKTTGKDLVLVIDLYLPAGTSPRRAGPANTTTIVKGAGMMPTVVAMPGMSPTPLGQ